MLVLAGVAMGAAIAVMWFPPPAPPARTERIVERLPPLIEHVAPGHRGVVLRADGTPAAYVDVYLTEQLPERQRIYHSIRTNFAGHFRLRVPPGRYRVQAFTGRAEVLDRMIDVPAEEHPDLELRMEAVSLFRWLADR